MMKKHWFIDDVDIYATYGVMILEGTISSLVAFPESKKPDTNDWAEHDGIEVDLTNGLKLSNKIVNVNFAIVNPQIFAVDSFLSFVSSKGYHSFYMKEIGRTWLLRIQNEQSRNICMSGQTFTIQFVDDFPIDTTQQFSYEFLASEAEEMIVTDDGLYFIDLTDEMQRGYKTGYKVPHSAYLLDSTRFSDLGIWIEEGRGEIFKMPALKDNLVRNISTIDSVLVDPLSDRFKAKDIVLKCAILTRSVNTFWNIYSRFFEQLIKPEQRELSVDYTRDSYPCFYKSADNFNFHLGSDLVLLKFNLTLTITNTRPKNILEVLGTEDNARIIISENNIYVIST